MEKITTYSQIFYEGLEEGKILAVRCKDCGAYEFPPVPICNTCGKHNMELVEISGEGTLVGFNDCRVPILGEDVGPVLSGVVVLKEGPSFYAFITGVDLADRDALYYKLPLRVKAEISQRKGFKYVDFRVVE